MMNYYVNFTGLLYNSSGIIVGMCLSYTCVFVLWMYVCTIGKCFYHMYVVWL